MCLYVRIRVCTCVCDSITRAATWVYRLHHADHTIHDTECTLSLKYRDTGYAYFSVILSGAAETARRLMNRKNAHTHPHEINAHIEPTYTQKHTRTSIHC